MGKALSLDLRRRSVDAYNRGEGTQVAIAMRFGVGEATLRRWLRRDEEGRLAFDDSYHHGPERTIEVASMAVLEELLRETPDATNSELAALMATRTGLTVSASTISRAIAILGWSRKKSASSPAKPMPRVSAIFVSTGSRGSRR